MGSQNGSTPHSRPRILIITTVELAFDPRARRAAGEAGARGLAVQGLCISDEQGQSAVPVKRVPSLHLEQRIRAAGLGRLARGSRVVREVRGVYRLGRHALITARFVRAARGLERCEIIHANDFDTLPAGAHLARRWHSRLVYDSHELYTFQEPDPPRLYCAVVLRIERALARRSNAVITVSERFAALLSELLWLERPPFIVMNCPPVQPAPEPAAHDRQLRVIYQAAVGPGRRVEDVVEAAAHAGDAHITIRVVGADTKALTRLIEAKGLGDRVELSDPVPAGTLVEALVPVEVGVIINRPVTMNDELATPNKLFEYIQARLPIASSRLPMVERILNANGNGAYVDFATPESTADELRSFVLDVLPRFTDDTLDRAATNVNWERDEVALFRTLDAALAARPT